MAEEGERHPSTGVVFLYELLIYMVLAHQRERQSQKGSHVQVVRSSTSFVSIITSPRDPQLQSLPFLSPPVNQFKLASRDHVRSRPIRRQRTSSHPARHAPTCRRGRTVPLELVDPTQGHPQERHAKPVIWRCSPSRGLQRRVRRGEEWVRFMLPLGP